MERELALGQIVVDPTIQIREGNHEPTIRRYEEAFEKLPPVDVFDTPEGLLLADGFHRIAAAERLGLATIKANIRKGTREDALEWSVIGNTKNADPLTPEERDDGIRRLKQLHPGWSSRQLADAMSVSDSTAQRVFKIDEVKREVLPGTGGTRVPDSHYREIAAAPKEAWASLVKAADQRGWSRDATALAVRNLKDDRVPKERKREILEGRADPVVVTSEGEFAVPAEVVGRQIREMAANDAILAFERALELLAKARLFRAEAILDPASTTMLDRWAKELPDDIVFLQEVLTGAKESGKLRVVGVKEA